MRRGLDELSENECLTAGSCRWTPCLFSHCTGMQSVCLSPGTW